MREITLFSDQLRSFSIDCSCDHIDENAIADHFKELIAKNYPTGTSWIFLHPAMGPKDELIDDLHGVKLVVRRSHGFDQVRHLILGAYIDA